MLRCRAGVVLLMLAVATGGSRAQAPPMVPSTASRTNISGSGFLSPSVIAAYNFSPGDAGMSKLEVLVLWRGQPSWYMGQGGGGSSASGRSIGAPGSTGSTWMNTATYGNVQLSVSANFSTSVLVVQGQTFDLRRANVIFMDAIDAPSGPVVTATFRIDAQVPTFTSPDILTPLLNAMPDLRAFLRCGVSGPRSTPGLAGVCGKVGP